jgi:nuclease-like protein
MPDPSSEVTTKRMRLRYAGVCRSCGIDLGSGTTALYDRVAKNVTCLACADAAATALHSEEPRPAVSDDDQTARDLPADQVSPGDPVETQPPVAEPVVFAGTAGASARREHERRRATRESRIRTAHPRLGGLILALSDEPTTTQVWATGAKGEEMLAARLDQLAAQGVRLLHDRRIPPTKANIDHIAIAPAGVFVIDAKRYKGRPQLRIEGGFIRPRTETLVVGGRNCTKLVDGVRKQVQLVQAALSGAGIGDVPVHGMLCFVQADWPMFGGAFSIDGVQVLWPKKATEHLLKPGTLQLTQLQTLHQLLATKFPVA